MRASPTCSDVEFDQKRGSQPRGVVSKGNRQTLKFKLSKQELGTGRVALGGGTVRKP